MIPGQKLFNMMKTVSAEANPSSEKVSLIYATVTSVNPIAILPKGFSESIPADFIEVGALCRRYVLPIPHIHHDVPPDTPTTSIETEEIEVWRGLRVGDRVTCFRFNDGQLYYINQRVEMEGFR